MGSYYQARNPYNQKTILFTGMMPGHIYKILAEQAEAKSRSKAAIVSECLEVTLDLPTLLRYTAVRVMQDRSQRDLTPHELAALHFVGEQIYKTLKQARS